MVILGIDPGLAIVGYGVIRSERDQMHTIDYGCIYTDAKLRLPDRLSIIYRGMKELFELFKPDAVAVEELFFSKNVTTGIAVAHARGTILCAAVNHTENLFEYTPMQVKQAVVGYGKAEKHQVQSMVKMLLNLNSIPKPDDAADALAVAICHAHSAGRTEEFLIK